MAPDNNGNYTPPVYGDPRNGPATGSMGWAPPAEVRSMPATRPEAHTTQVELRGDIKKAEEYIPVARQQMAMMHQQNVNGLEIYNRPIDLGNGRKMRCQRSFTADKAIIEVPGGGGEKGPFWMNFDAGKQNNFSDTFTDHIMGYGLQYSFDDNPPSNFELNGSLGVGVKTYRVVNQNTNAYASGGLYHEIVPELSRGYTVYAAFTSGGFWLGPEAEWNVAGGGYSHVAYYAGGMPSLGFDIGLGTGWGSGGYGDTSHWRIYFDGDDNNYSGSIVGTYKNFLVCGTVKPASNDSFIVRYFIDGEMVNEYENIGASSFDDKALIHQGSGCYNEGYSCIRQSIIEPLVHSEDQVKQITDKLATKWGF